MRTRAGWIALVLTGGLALAPAGVQAQPGGLDTPAGREAEPVIPLPIGQRRPENGGLYAGIEFLMMRQTRDLGPQALAWRGGVDLDGTIQGDLGGAFVIVGNTVQFVPGPPGPPGSFVGSGVEALNVDQLNSQWTYQPGYRLTLGWRFSDGSTFEARHLHVREAKYTASADIIPRNWAVGPQLLDTWLFSPVFNFTNAFSGQFIELGVGNAGAGYGIWNFAQEMSIQFKQRYDQTDFWGKRVIREDELSRTYVVAGGRHAWIWEGFQWRAVSRDSVGDGGPQDVAEYTNIVSNSMYGPVLGCQHDVYLGSFERVGAFSVQLHTDVATMVNFVALRAKYERGDRQASSKKSVSEYTFAPQVTSSLMITWYPINGVQVRLGWDSFVFLNTFHSQTPVSFNFGQIGATQNFGPQPGADNRSDSIWERKAIRWFDGFSFGLAVSF